MPRAALVVGLALAGLLGAAAPARAMDQRRPMGMYAGPTQQPLALVDSHVELTVRGPFVEAIVVQRFRNTTGHPTEATYIFPLPDDAADPEGLLTAAESALLPDPKDARVRDLVADHVVVATGAWTTDLLPNLKGILRGVGQPVFHLRPKDPALFRHEVFPVFGADISRTGYYGFPIQADGVVKIANHGIGRPMHPESSAREVTAAEERALRDFLAESFPALLDAPIVYTRICVYGDSRDEHFWISRHPDIEGLVIAAGGSGHGFKFGPVIGDLVADALHGIAHPALERFRYRTEVNGQAGHEAARYRGSYEK